MSNLNRSLRIMMAVLGTATGCQRDTSPPPASAPVFIPDTPAPKPVVDPSLPSAEDVAKVARAIQPFGGEAVLTPAESGLRAVTALFFLKPLKEADVPEVARRLAETNVPIVLSLVSSARLSVKSYRQLFELPNLRSLAVDDDNAVQALKDHPGSSQLEALVLHAPTVTDLGVATKFPNLRSLQVIGDNLTGPGVVPLGKLTKLRGLRLSGKKLTGTDLAPLAKLTELRALSLTGPNLDNADLAPIAKLTKLERLWVYGPKLTTAAFVHIANLTDLKSASLNSSSPILDHTDFTLAYLARLDKLQSLGIRGPEVTDAGLAHLKGMTGLRTLRLDGVTGVTAAGMKVIAELPNLESLSIAGAHPTEEAFAVLASAPRLKSVSLEHGGPPRPGAKVAQTTTSATVADKYLETIGRMPALENLSIVNFYSSTEYVLSDKGLAGLSQASHLRRFKFHGLITASDAGFAHLGRLGEMTELKLFAHGSGSAMPPVTDAALDVVAKLHKLQKLRLDHMPFTDVGIAKLATLPELRFLSLDHGKVTGKLMDELAKFPKLQMVSIYNLTPPLAERDISRLAHLTRGRIRFAQWQ
jgi:Leucine-rich repeat (LRR) protein